MLTDEGVLQEVLHYKADAFSLLCPHKYVVVYGKGQACSLGKTIKGAKEIEFRKPCFNTQKCTQKLLLFDCAV